MSENDRKAWRIDAAKPHELTDLELVDRLLHTAYAHGAIGERRGLDSEAARRLKRRAAADRDELKGRLS